MKNMVRRLVYLACLAGLFYAQGCATKPPSIRRTVRINFDPALEGSSIKVDVLALDTDRALKFQNESMTRYWSPDASAKPYDYLTKWIVFDGDPGEEYVVTTDDPVWTMWERNGADYIFVLANLPGDFKDENGTADSRRLITTLDPARWRRYDQIKVVVKPNDAVLLTEPLPPPLDR